MKQNKNNSKLFKNYQQTAFQYRISSFFLQIGFKSFKRIFLLNLLREIPKIFVGLKKYSSSSYQPVNK